MKKEDKKIDEELVIIPFVKDTNEAIYRIKTIENTHGKDYRQYPEGILSDYVILKKLVFKNEFADELNDGSVRHDRYGTRDFYYKFLMIKIPEIFFTPKKEKYGYGIGKVIWIRRYIHFVFMTVLKVAICEMDRTKNYGQWTKYEEIIRGGGRFEHLVKPISNGILEIEQAVYKTFYSFFFECLSEAQANYMTSVRSQTENRENPHENSSKVKAPKAMIFALAYFFECEALDDRPYQKQGYTNEDLEDDLFKRYNGKKSGNSIRKALDKIKAKGNNMRFRDAIENLAGYQDWRQDVLAVTACPDKVAAYIKNNLEP